MTLLQRSDWDRTGWFSAQTCHTRTFNTHIDSIQKTYQSRLNVTPRRISFSFPGPKKKRCPSAPLIVFHILPSWIVLHSPATCGRTFHRFIAGAIPGRSKNSRNPSESTWMGATRCGLRLGSVVPVMFDAMDSKSCSVAGRKSPAPQPGQSIFVSTSPLKSLWH